MSVKSNNASKKSDRDLSKYHGLISDLFQYPKSPEERKKYELSREQIDHFNQFGYVSNIKILEDWQVDTLNDELAELMDPGHPGRELFYEFFSNESSVPNQVLFHCLGHWRIAQGFHDALWNPAFVIPASQLLGNQTVRFWHDQLFCKPPKNGGVVAWHQDYSYWTRTVAMQHLTCWTGLDDSTRENGCLRYVPGSHKWGLLKKPELAGKMDGLFEFLTDEQKNQFKPVSIELKKGYGSFHHPLLVHGSNENYSDMSRRAMVINVFADGTVSNTNEELLRGVPIIEKGKRLEGAFFPVLTDSIKV